MSPWKIYSSNQKKGKADVIPISQKQEEKKAEKRKAALKRILDYAKTLKW